MITHSTPQSIHTEHLACGDVAGGMVTAALIAAAIGFFPTAWVVRLSRKVSQRQGRHCSNKDESQDAELQDVTQLRPSKKKGTSDTAPANFDNGEGIHHNHKMAPEVAFVLYVSEILLNMNFTVVLPTSYEVAKRTSAGASASGLIIGAHGVGFLIALPLFVKLSRVSCRNGYLLFSLFMVIGNLLYVFCVADPEKYGIVSVLAVRTLTGLECGGTLLGWIVAYRANGPGCYPEVTSVRIAAGAIGLMSGPLLASLCHSLPGADSWFNDAVPFFMFAIAGVVFGAVVFFWFPENSKIPGLVSGNSKLHSRSSAYAEAVVDKSWLALALDISMTLLRVIQRVGWEAGALYIVAEEFALGTTAAGYLVPLSLSGLLVAQPIFVKLNKLLEPEQLADTLHTAEFIGLAFMLRLTGPPTTASLASFSVGSCIYYCANMSGAAVYSPFRGKNALARHPMLNLETSSVLQMLAVSGGYFVGPVLYRGILDRCLHQNVLVSAALVLFACQVVISKSSLHVLTAKVTAE